MDDLVQNYAAIPQSKRLSLVLLGVICLVGLYWVVFHQDAEDQLGFQRGRLSRETAEMSKKKAYLDNMSKYEARFNELQQNLEHARSVLPDTADVPQLLSQLGNKARQTGLQIDYFEPQGEEDKGFYSEIMFGMRLRGSFHEIAMFIDAVGKMDRIVNVTGISMTSPEAVNQKIIVQGEFTIKTYRFKKDG